MSYFNLIDQESIQAFILIFRVLNELRKFISQTRVEKLLRAKDLEIEKLKSQIINLKKAHPKAEL